MANAAQEPVMLLALVHLTKKGVMGKPQKVQKRWAKSRLDVSKLKSIPDTNTKSQKLGHKPKLSKRLENDNFGQTSVQVKFLELQTRNMRTFPTVFLSLPFPAPARNQDCRFSQKKMFQIFNCPTNRKKKIGKIFLLIYIPGNLPGWDHPRCITFWEILFH